MGPPERYFHTGRLSIVIMDFHVAPEPTLVLSFLQSKRFNKKFPGSAIQSGRKLHAFKMNDYLNEYMMGNLGVNRG